MAGEEDKEKAEKLAAAKKRYEQMKKQQKGKKGSTKKKEGKTEDSAASEDKAEPAADDAIESKDEPEDNNDETVQDQAEPEENDEAKDTVPDTDDAKSTKARQPSLTLQSRQRSESFRKGAAVSPGLKSPSQPPLDSEAEVQELYRKQTAKIEELEKANKGLKDSRDEALQGLKKREEELQSLREESGDTAGLKSKATLADDRAKEIERLTNELSSTQRQLSQAQQSANKTRRQSLASPSVDYSEQLASKTSTIESLELELSNLRNQVNLLESEKTSNESNIRDLETRATSAESTLATAQQEVEKLKSSLSAPPASNDKSEDEDPAALNRKISALQSDLRTAQSSADTAVTRANNLESKIDALTKLHRDAAQQNVSKDTEIKTLKSRINSLQSSKTDAGGEDLSDLEDEEREKLQARIRDLEAETFELRRGVWRDKRTAMQPLMTDDESMQNQNSAASPYEDVDLTNSASPYGPRSAGVGRQSSTFSDVLQSGISAFTGRGARGQEIYTPRGGPHERKASLGLMSEDGFDEDAFARAHEEEAKKRIERVKEVKRGLSDWRGWRVDIADLRSGGLPGASTGPVLEA